MTNLAYPTAVDFPKTRRFTVEEYIQYEIKTNQKHYFINGKLIPMAGGKPPHTKISGNVYFCLRLSTRPLKPRFEVFNSEMKIFIPVFQTYNYPDASVICEKPVFTNDAAEALKNPVLIVEVLSKSTKSYDQKAKFKEYQSIPTFREYVLIHQDKPVVQTFLKDKNGSWNLHSEFFGLNSMVKFESVPVVISMADIYENVDFE